MKPGVPAANIGLSSAQWIALAIIALHFVLLALSLGDWRVSIDSGFHLSLAEWYAHHGSAWWDHINFGPRGRPNLQGPGLHAAIAALGLVLGGRPDDFILANAILALAQWCAAVATLYFFARRLGGNIAAMIAVALFAGSAFTCATYYAGVPAGWVFISVPWAIYFFLEDRLALATLITVAGCYTHLGGFVTAPAALVLAAAIERRWRSLLKVGAASAILTSPYLVHFFANLSWYRGRHAHEALHFDPMLDLLALAGVAWMLARRRDVLLLCWVFGPIAWLLQDPYRFVLQEGFAGSVLGALMLAALLDRMANRKRRFALAVAIVLLATLFPFGPPGLAGEVSWDLGYRYPRMLDWNRVRSLAAVIERNHLQSRLLAVYENSLGSAIAVFAPVTVEKSHWVEVQPRHDPADDLSAGAKAYVVPLSPGDPMLAQAARGGLLTIYGGTADCAVITLTRPGDPASIGPGFSASIIDNAQWLSEHAVNNRMLRAKYFEMPRFTSPEALERWREAAQRQRTRAGRMELATLLYAYALEAAHPRAAKALRAAALGFGEIASFLSDGDPAGDVSDARHRQFRRDLRALASTMRAHRGDPIASAAVRQAFVKLFEDYFQIALPVAITAPDAASRSTTPG